MRSVTPDDVFLRRRVGRWSITKAWDEAMHPRDDKGQFISGADLNAAKTDAGKASELRARTTDPVQLHRLDAIIGDSPDAGSDAPTSGADAVRFPPSKAPVNYGNFGKEAAVAKLKTFLPNITGADHEFASLVGAPDDATVHVREGYGDSLAISVQHPEIQSCMRTIQKDENGNVYIHNSILQLRTTGQEAAASGRARTVEGYKLLSKQVDYARKLGVTYIDTHAAGSKGGSMNGYFTWPNLGYDAPINRAHRGADFIKQKFPGAKTMLDVMATKEGREWWSEHGSDVEPMVFDLDPRSRSSLTLAAYVQHKEATTAAKKQGAPAPLAPERPGKDLVSLTPARERRPVRQTPAATPRAQFSPTPSATPPATPANRVQAHEANVRQYANESARHRTSVPEQGRSAVNSLSSSTPVGAAAYVAWAHHNLTNAATPEAEQFWQGRLATHIEHYRGFPKNERAVGAEAFPQVVGILNRQRVVGNNPTTPTPVATPPEVQRPTPERQRRNRQVVHGRPATEVLRWMAGRNWSNAEIRSTLGAMGVEISHNTATSQAGGVRSGRLTAPELPEALTQKLERKRRR